jgi:hypothetical protein
MRLYEVTNGYLGEAYTRLYAWAETEEQALEMAKEQLKQEATEDVPWKPRHPEAYWKNLKAQYLFDANDAPFATKPSDAGWET